MSRLKESERLFHPATCRCGACDGDSELVGIFGNVDGQGRAIGDNPVWDLDETAANLNRTAYEGTDIGGAGWSNAGYDARPASGDRAELRFGFHTQATMDDSTTATAPVLSPPSTLLRSPREPR